MMQISQEFLTRLKLHPEPAYRIAQSANLDPATLSKLIHGAIRLHPSDPRITAVGEILGLTESECFETGAEER